MNDPSRVLCPSLYCRDCASIQFRRSIGLQPRFPSTRTLTSKIALIRRTGAGRHNAAVEASADPPLPLRHTNPYSRAIRCDREGPSSRSPPRCGLGDGHCFSAAYKPCIATIAARSSLNRSSQGMSGIIRATSRSRSPRRSDYWWWTQCLRCSCRHPERDLPSLLPQIPAAGCIR